jgi:hypothetical protein
LYSTAYTAAEVRDGLGVNDSRVRQRRAARTLWAIDDNGRWVYPALQFEVAGAGRGKSLRLRLVRGLDQVLPHWLMMCRILLPPWWARLASWWPDAKISAGVAGKVQYA